ncbi:MAG: YciI family protein [Candidatus Binataceae bacterium]
MNFLCLVYFEQGTLSALSPDEKASLDRDSMAYDEELRRSGHYIVANALEPAGTARTVRVRRGKASATDGPFAETKEHLGGFILIDAANLNEAVDIAAGIPLAKLGSIEVRPIMELGQGPVKNTDPLH